MGQPSKVEAEVREAAEQYKKQFELLQCAGCGRRPEEISDYTNMVKGWDWDPETDPLGTQIEAKWAALTEEEKTQKVREYVLDQEGTLNTKTGAFTCDACYIVAGMPSSPEGWIVPDGGEWPTFKDEMKARYEKRGETYPGKE